MTLNPPTLYWAAELAVEAGGEPIHGLIHGDSYGLFCWDLRHWARPASPPDDAIELGPRRPDDCACGDESRPGLHIKGAGARCDPDFYTRSIR